MLYYLYFNFICTDDTLAGCASLAGLMNTAQWLRGGYSLSSSEAMKDPYSPLVTLNRLYHVGYSIGFLCLVTIPFYLRTLFLEICSFLA